MTTERTIPAIVIVPEDGFEEHGKTLAQISMDKLEKELVAIQGQLTDLIEGVKGKLPAKNGPTSISIGLAISGDAGIGVATVGAEVAIQLTFDLR